MKKENHGKALLDWYLGLLAYENFTSHDIDRAKAHVTALVKENKLLKAENKDLKTQLKPDTELAESDLPSCPFCGCDKLYMTSMPRFPGLPRKWSGGMAYSVACGGCAAQGGWEKSASGARRDWAMRTNQTKRTNLWKNRCSNIAEILEPAIKHHPVVKDHCNLCMIYEIATGRSRE